MNQVEGDSKRYSHLVELCAVIGILVCVVIVIVVLVVDGTLRQAGGGVLAQKGKLFRLCHISL
jgi:hypothetical protein